MQANKVTPIGQLKHLADKAPVSAVEGTIKAIYAISNSPPTSSRRWSRQDLILTDRTGEIRVKVWNQEEIPSNWKGKHIRIDHFVDAKDKSCDLAVSHNEYQGNVEVQLKADKRAIITDMAGARSAGDVGEGYREARQERQQERQDPPPRQQQQRRDAPPPDHEPRQQQRSTDAPAPDPLREAKKLLARYRGLWNVCYDAAVATGHDVLQRHGYAMVPGAIGIIADKMFAEMCRKIGHDIHSLPLDPYERREDGTAEYKGRPLTELIAALNQQVAEHRSGLPNAPTAPLQQDSDTLPF